MKKSIKYGTIIGVAVLPTILIPVILFIHFFIGFGSYDKFSAKYDKDVVKYILKHKSFLENSNHDTIFVVDYDYHECSMDPRTFIDKKYSRPFIQSELKSLGYNDIFF
ncbi:MAG TPA: hypothetical protein PLL90_05915, partial [Bacteroidales bacterium]|nr:hypothetical protein [Bacteroidales bacterium]